MRAAFSLLSPGGSNGRLTTMIFHRVLDKHDPLFPEEIDAADFDRICRWTAEWFNVLPLGEALRRLKAGTLPRRAMAITFDDGYEDNYCTAVPILVRHGLQATFFIATGFLDGGTMWNDRLIEAVRCTRLTDLDLLLPGETTHRILPLGGLAQRRRAIDELISAVKYLDHEQRLAAVETVEAACAAESPSRGPMMTSDQVHGLVRHGMEVGGHTVTHPILRCLKPEASSREIVQGKRQLESIVGRPVAMFAYPNGKPGVDYAAVAVQQVREAGFEAAVSTGWGVADQSTDPYQIPRFTPWDRSRTRFGIRLMSNLRRKPTTV